LAENEGFARRWSQRKAAARQQAREDARQTDPEQPIEAAAPPAGEAPAPVDPQTLPDPETLTAESDFSPFLREGVPEDLQRVALRRLWRLDPVLANLDGLVDYGEDFTDAATVVQGMQSVYQVGRGMATAFEKPEEEAEAADAAADAGAGVPPPEIEPGAEAAVTQESTAATEETEDDQAAASGAVPSDSPKSA
jgi:hypothetical protein